MPIYRFLHSFLIIRLIELTVTQPNCDQQQSGSVHASGTGTVLFNPTDVHKTCWSQEEIAILSARMILEDVIPDPKVVSVNCNDDIDDLVEYFKSVIETIRSQSRDRKRHILLLALTDLMGGYLHHALLPMARMAYYSGAVDYTYMEKLIQLYEELKWFLRSNGQGWTKPMKVTKEVRVEPIVFTTADVGLKQNKSVCTKLLYYEHEPLNTRRKRSVALEKGVYFPLPFLDARLRPNAIVVPLKKFPLRSIESKRAAYIVMKYYIHAENCLKEKGAKPGMVQSFQNNLYTWIDKDVLPKLGDDKFYSAFGGILRVRTTLIGTGARLGSSGSCNSDFGEEEVGAVPGVGCGSNRNKILLIAMLVVIVAWFLIGTCFICYRMKHNKSAISDENPPDKPTTPSSKLSSLLGKSSSSKRLCKCCESSATTDISSTSYSTTSENDSGKSKKKRFPVRKSAPCVCPEGGPAIIDSKHSMKTLPSISEQPEMSSKYKGVGKKISFADQSSTGGPLTICAPPWSQSKSTVVCPKYSSKATSYSSSSGKSAADVSMSEDISSPDPHEKQTAHSQTTPPQNATTSTTHQHSSDSEHGHKEEENAGVSPNDDVQYQVHIATCHSTLTGSYDLFRKGDPSGPLVFGYDFQTSTSSETDEEYSNYSK